MDSWVASTSPMVLPQAALSCPSAGCPWTALFLPDPFLPDSTLCRSPQAAGPPSPVSLPSHLSSRSCVLLSFTTAQIRLLGQCDWGLGSQGCDDPWAKWKAQLYSRGSGAPSSMSCNKHWRPSPHTRLRLDWWTGMVLGGLVSSSCQTKSFWIMHNPQLPSLSAPGARH